MLIYAQDTGSPHTFRSKQADGPNSGSCTAMPGPVGGSTRGASFCKDPMSSAASTACALLRPVFW